MNKELFPDDAQERAKLNKLIEELQSKEFFGYDYFNEVYKICVERKRRKLLEAIKEMDSNAHSLHEPILADEAWMKRMVLYTYYVYLKDDDAYRQKAFAEFLKKRIEGMDDKTCVECWGMHAYLEGLYEHSDYAEYQQFKEPYCRRMGAYQPKIWREFFQNSEEYVDVIPSERPPVLYTDNNMYIPRFVFEPPYIGEYAEWVFYDRFMKEWDLTHCNPLVYGDFYNHFIDLALYRNELADKPKKAYHDYQKAVITFKQIQQALKPDAE